MWQAELLGWDYNSGRGFDREAKLILLLGKPATGNQRFFQSIGRCMKCPFCRVDNDKVIDSRTSEDGFSIRRRRECQGCSKRFTTYERVAELDMRVVKKDGSRQPFSPDKIRRGLELACWKRPIPTEAVERIICEILQEIYLLGDEEIESDRIGEMIMERLFKLDQVAYIRFASVYREFKDVRDFVDEVQPFLFRSNKQKELS